jgi:hypothetical protein
MPSRLPARPAKQSPAQAAARAIAAKRREEQLRQQAALLAKQAKADQLVAQAKQDEIARLRQAVVKCADAYKMAKDVLVKFEAQALPPVGSSIRTLHMQKRQQIAAALHAAGRALNVARAALSKALGEGTAAASSPAQQTLPVVQKALEQAKQETKTETTVAVQAGAPQAALPPAGYDPVVARQDDQIAAVAKDAVKVAEKTAAVADAAASDGSKAAAAAGAPPPPPATEAPPPAVVEDAAKAAQDAVNEAVGAKQGSVLPILAVAGVIGAFLIMRKK